MHKTPSLMILGCGDIGQRLAIHPTLANWRIFGVRRSKAVASGALADHSGFSYCQADISQPEQLQAILPTELDYLLVTMTPSERSAQGYQRAYVDTATVLQQTLQQVGIRPKRIFFVSSTSVFGQSDGEAVDERAAAEPSSYAGQKLLAAEAVYQASSPPSSVVRFSGIYGPGRFRLIEQALATELSTASAGAPQYSNRLHIEDCAAILAHLLQQSEQGATLDDLYIGTDCEPSELHEVRGWLRSQAQLQLDPLPNIAPAAPSARKAPAKNSTGYSRSSKRLSNQRLLDTGYQFIYPTFREGYQPVLDEYIEQYLCNQQES